MVDANDSNANLKGELYIHIYLFICCHASNQLLACLIRVSSTQCSPGVTVTVSGVHKGTAYLDKLWASQRLKPLQRWYMHHDTRCVLALPFAINSWWGIIPQSYKGILLNLNTRRIQFDSCLPWNTRDCNTCNAIYTDISSKWIFIIFYFM